MPKVVIKWYGVRTRGRASPYKTLLSTPRGPVLTYRHHTYPVKKGTEHASFHKRSPDWIFFFKSLASCLHVDGQKRRFSLYDDAIRHVLYKHAL